MFNLTNLWGGVSGGTFIVKLSPMVAKFYILVYYGLVVDVCYKLTENGQYTFEIERFGSGISNQVVTYALSYSVQ